MLVKTTAQWGAPFQQAIGKCTRYVTHYVVTHSPKIKIILRLLNQQQHHHSIARRNRQQFGLLNTLNVNNVGCHLHFKVGYVNCSTTTRYTPSGGGWHADPLLALPSNNTLDLVAESYTTPLWLTLSIPSDATPGTYHGNVTVTVAGSDAQNVPVSVTVWPLPALPGPRQLYEQFGEIWSFTTNGFTGVLCSLSCELFSYTFVCSGPSELQSNKRH